MVQSMKVKEFSNYRAPKRRPWIPVLVFVLLVAGIVWFVRRPRSEKTPAVVEPPAATEEQVALPAAPAKPASPQPKPAAAAPRPAPAPVAAPPAAPVVLSGDVSVLVQQAAKHKEANQLQAARELYQRALQLAQEDGVRAEIEKRLGDVHIELVFSPRPMAEKVDYVIQRGDQLRVLARRFRTTTDLIQRGNNITDPNRIRIGDRLRIFSGAFELVASKSRRDMVVYLNGDFFKRYRIGTGEFGKTPVGTFVIREKIVEPSWWPPDGREVPFGHPENILGTRWLSFEATGDTPRVRGFGIHGTWAPESIGLEESAGCIRMINEQVEELYVYIPAGTPLRIVD
jgi:lipoprotein-anchoring transpeptidase ErfK/SrfK